jgi:ectoine hydroxylase-related dioxygenase (phytanoyl-CoA dioxygenase family)
MNMSTVDRICSSSVLSAEARRGYDEDGFIVVRGVFTAEETARLASEADRLLDRTDLIDKENLRCRFQANCTGGDCVFETFDPVIDLSAAIRDVALDSRILQLLAEIYTEEACLLKDKLIYKPPGAMGYALHQDYIAWPAFPRSFLTVLVPIDATNAENGCTEVFAGRHRQGALSAEDGDYHELSDDVIRDAEGVLLELEPGDLAIFGGFTPHRSGPNRSNGWRRQLYLSYNAASDGGDQRAGHYREFHRFLRRKYAGYGLTDTYFL